MNITAVLLSLCNLCEVIFPLTDFVRQCAAHNFNNLHAKWCINILTDGTIERLCSNE